MAAECIPPLLIEQRSDLQFSGYFVEEVIIRSLQGTTSAPEENRLRRWRLESAENEKRYNDVARVWALTESGRIRSANASRPSASELIHLSDARLAPGSPAPVQSMRSWSIGAIAAAAMLMLAFGLAQISGARSDTDVFAATELTTGPAEMATVRLRDGSVVRLAPNSQLRVTPTGNTREVWLDGKAYFAVAKDQRRPFVVRTRAGDAQVLGTSFEVRLDEENFRVAVVEGRVAVSVSDSTVQVGAGQQSRTAPGGAPSLEPFHDALRELEWLRGFLVFRDTPLSHVVRQLEQHYGVQVLLTDSALARRTVTATFTDRTAAEVLAVVCRVVDAHCSLQDSIIRIEP